MAKYRQVHTSFWQDGFVLDLTPEEKYFYLYLMTNSKTSQCGIYELPKRIIEIETGYNRETVQKLLQRFVDYRKIDYFEGTKEIYIKKWIRYNPPNNANVVKCIVKELNEVKNLDFAVAYAVQAAKEGYVLKGFGADLEGITNTPESNKKTNNKEEVTDNKETKATDKSIEKKHYAENVIMSTEEYEKLINEYGEAFIKEKIIDLNLWKGSKGKRTKSDYMTILAWIRKDKKEFQKNIEVQKKDARANAGAYDMI